MGVYDIPAMYKQILSFYPQTKINVIGYSQGTSEMFAGLLDEVSGEFLTEHTGRFIAMAPIVYLNHIGSWFYTGLATAIMGQSNFSNFKKVIPIGVYRVTNSFFGLNNSLPMTCRTKNAFTKFQ